MNRTKPHPPATNGALSSVGCVRWRTIACTFVAFSAGLLSATVRPAEAQPPGVSTNVPRSGGAGGAPAARLVDDLQAWSEPGRLQSTLKTLAVLTVLSLAPAALLMDHPVLSESRLS